MRFMIMRKADKETEAGARPSELRATEERLRAELDARGQGAKRP